MDNGIVSAITPLQEAKATHPEDGDVLWIADVGLALLQVRAILRDALLVPL